MVEQINPKEKGSDVISFVQHMKMGKDHMESFIRDRPKAAISMKFKTYLAKVDWIFKDLLSCIFFSQEVREGIRKEIESDVFIIPALNEKIALLPVDVRDTLETIVDELLKGSTITVNDKTNKDADQSI